LLFRTLLFIPGNNERFIKKSLVLDADILCYDLEDSVPVKEKDVARDLLKMYFREQKVDNIRSSIYVRINSSESGLAKADLLDTIQSGVDGIVLPKINNSEEVNEVTKIIKELELERGLGAGRIAIIPSIETARGVVNTYSIARANERVIAVVFGVFDFLHDMDIGDYGDAISYSYARSKIPVEAKAANVASLDAIWQNVNDIDGLISDATTARKFGYSGKSLIHPSHIRPVHEVFLPTPKQIEWAKKVFEALDGAMEGGSGSGAVKLDGKMIDAVHYKQAKAILEMIRAMKL
jgi:citrate lyase subunit beta/citryl-CoA lyase